MKHSLIILSILLLQGCIKKQSPPEVVQSSKYESVNQCVLQTMTEKKLTGNKMFEMVKDECERSLRKIDHKGKGSRGILYLGYRGGIYRWSWKKWEGVESENNKDIGKYEGEIKNGVPNGQGIFTFPDGRKYEGELKDGDYNGQGTYTYSDGSKYIGEWKGGNRNGQGKDILPDGSTYIGGWKNGKQHGEGTYTWLNGDKYVGEYKDNIRTGQGTFTWSNGNKYVGQYENGLRNGQGTFTWSNGNKYIGQYKDDKQNGQGKMILPDGKKYVGKWKNGRPWHGIGYKNNGKIEFRVKNGKRQ